MEVRADSASRAIAESCRIAMAEHGPYTRNCESRLLQAHLSRLLDGAKAAETANADLDLAMQNAEERSLRAFMPRIYAERAAVAIACGDKESWKRALMEAIAISKAIGAPRRAERYERELGGEH